MSKQELMDKLNVVSADDLIALEAGELDEEAYVEAVQKLINSGMVWRMQGAYGRLAMDLIRNGDCVLGEEGCFDAYGNYVPSRDEVQAGTPGSLEYQQKMQEN